jgi:hypothetical protein
LQDRRIRTACGTIVGLTSGRRSKLRAHGLDHLRSRTIILNCARSRSRAEQNTCAGLEPRCISILAVRSARDQRRNTTDGKLVLRLPYAYGTDPEARDARVQIWNGADVARERTHTHEKLPVMMHDEATGIDSLPPAVLKGRRRVSLRPPPRMTQRSLEE